MCFCFKWLNTSYYSNNHDSKRWLTKERTLPSDQSCRYIPFDFLIDATCQRKIYFKVTKSKSMKHTRVIWVFEKVKFNIWREQTNPKELGPALMSCKKDQLLLLKLWFKIHQCRQVMLWMMSRMFIALVLHLTQLYYLFSSNRVTTSTQIIPIKTFLMHLRRDWRSLERETCQMLCFCWKRPSCRTQTTQRWTRLMRAHFICLCNFLI